MLLVLVGKSLNCQAVFGRGLTNGGKSAIDSYVAGTLDDKGLFWGVTGNNGKNAVKVFGMENYWGCIMHTVAGMVAVYDATTDSKTIKIKLTHSNIDGTDVSSFNSTGYGYIDTGVEMSNTTMYIYISKMKYFDKGYLPLRTTGGSSTKYYSDLVYWYQAQYNFYLRLGGSVYNESGPFVHYMGLTLTSSGDGLGAALSLKPLALRG